MLKYEIRKLLFNKGLLLGIILLLIFNGANIFKQHYPSMEKEPVYAASLSIYQELKGRDIEKCIEIIENRKGSISELKPEDRELYSGVYEELSEELKEMKNCKETGKALKDKSIQRAEAYRGHNTYLFKLNSKIAELYSEREIREFHNVSKIRELINYKFSYILIIFLIIPAASEIFAYDRESGAWQVIKATRNGRKKIAGIKIIAVELYVTMAAALFGACNFLCFKLCYGFEGLRQPMYAIRAYKDMPVNDAIGVFLTKNFFLGLSGLSVTALLVMFFCVILRDRKTVFAASLAAALGLVFYRSFAYLGNGRLINIFNPIHCFLGEKIMLYYENIPLFGIAAPNSVIVIITAAAVNILLSGLVLFLYGKNLKKSFSLSFIRKIKQQLDRRKSEEGESRNG